MPARTPYSRRVSFPPVFAVLLLASCAEPLGPGYAVKKQSLEVHFLPGDPPQLEIRGRYRVKNTGNRELAFLDVAMPREEKSSRKNLRVNLDGSAVPASPTAKGGEVRISFPQPWARRAEHELSLEYDFAGSAVTSDSFLLPGPADFPGLLPPEGAFSEGGGRKQPLELSVRVPQGFLAHATGRARGTRKEGSEVVYRFQITKEDFDPFVVAGQYHEERFANRDTAIVFWTLKPSAPDPVATIAPSLAAVIKLLENDYGPLSRKRQPYWIAEQPVRSPAAGLSAVFSPDTNFPGGAVHSFVLSPPGEALAAKNIEINLARSWFEELAHPGDAADAVLGWALAEYAALSARAQLGQDPPDKAQRIAESIKLHDAERSKFREKPLLSLEEKDSEGQMNLGFIKARLFLDDLEDRCGRDNLHHALRHLVQSFRGSNYSYNELRSVVEQECHQDLGPIFRDWLTETGIPADFQQRYETKP